MHDSNGKKLQVGDEILTYRYGMCKIIEIKHNYMRAEGLQGGFGYTQEVFRKEMPEAIKVRTWKEMAQEALDVQNACNLTGVVISFAIIVREIRARLDAEGKGGTDHTNIHPICRAVG